MPTPRGHAEHFPLLSGRLRAIVKGNGGAKDVARKLSVITQVEVSHRTVEKWTQGIHVPSVIYLYELAQMSRVSVDWLLAKTAQEAGDIMRIHNVMVALKDWRDGV